ncbi:ribonuclease H-like domain-containing protein [Tanacetum coccineum]
MYPSISVGDGHSIPVTNTGHSIFPTPFKSLHLNNVLITYHIAKNLIFVRQFVPDNNYTIELDAFGFSVKDFMTHRVLLQCDSTGDLYPLTAPSLIPHVFLVSQHMWNQRLGHPGRDVLRHLVFNNFISCNKEKPPMLCHACQLGKHCDHEGKFDNRNLHKLFADNGIQFRFSCPKTSQQNGKFERMVRTINNLIRTLLFQANLLPTFWVEALNVATHLLNFLPSIAINNEIPYTRLFRTNPDYSLLRTFGCLCYPHIYTKHKLEPRATPSIYLGQASNHHGYRCLDLKTNKIIISRHVTFDETVFPYSSTKPALPPTYTFLDDIPDIIPPAIPTNPTVQLPPEPITPIHNTPIQHHPDADQLPTTPAVQQQTPTPAQSPTTQNKPVAQSPIIIPDPPENPNPVSVYPMVTRFRVGTNCPTECLNLHVFSVSPLPKSYRGAFSGPNWQNAMRDEYHALIKNKTWTLVPRPPDTNIVRCMWLFRHKYLADGMLSRYKARLVAIGITQLEGVDVDETFSLVVKPGTIRTVLSLAVFHHWLVHQLDVKNAFLHLDLSEIVYMHQPPRFRDSVHPDYLAHMVNCNPNQTPIDTESKLGSDGDPVSDPTLYRSLTGSLQYFTFTRPDISYVVQQVCLHMHDPREPHFYALKRILRYVRATLDYGLRLFSSSTTDLVVYSDADWAEYRGVTNAVAETCWLRNLLHELHTPLSSATLVYYLVAASQVQFERPVSSRSNYGGVIMEYLVKDSKRHAFWSLNEDILKIAILKTNTPKNDKVIKGEFEKIKDVKVEDVSLTCDTSLKVFNNEVNRLSGMDDDLFTYEVKIANIPCDSKMDNDSKHEADDGMGYDPSDVGFTGSKEMVKLSSLMKNLLIDMDEVLKSLGLLTRTLRGFKTYEYYKDDWIYEWNKDDYEWYEALEDSELKDEALRNKVIMERFMKKDDDESRYKQMRRWNINANYDDAYETNHGDNKSKELCEVHELPMCNIRRYMMTKYLFNNDEKYVAVKEDKYNNLTITREEACQAYQEIFWIMDEGWMVTRAE